MRLYLDEDSASALFVRLLLLAGHDVQVPADVGLLGRPDPIQFVHAVQDDRVLLSHNHDDFRNLHNVVAVTGGVHPGMMVVRRDADSSRNMTDRGIVRAIDNFLAAGVPIDSQFVILNHWR